MTDRELVFLAKGAAERAYAPYSRCRVGAALLAESGRVHLGCNVENASYSLTLCAERNAFFAAIARGEKKFTHIAIWAEAKGEESAFPPCGACLQVMAEFCDPGSFRVLVAHGDSFDSYLLGELIPHPFSPNHVK